jgi:hypothetical protein
MLFHLILRSEYCLGTVYDVLRLHTEDEWKEMLDVGRLRWKDKPPLLREQLLRLMKEIADGLNTKDPQLVFDDDSFNLRLGALVKENAAAAFKAKPPRPQAPQGAGCSQPRPGHGRGNEKSGATAIKERIYLSKRAVFEGTPSMEEALKFLGGIIPEAKLRDLLEKEAGTMASRKWPTCVVMWLSL